jgi:hypothetical protein
VQGYIVDEVRLDPGNYTVSTAIKGFESVTQQDIRLSANQNINASFTLHI